MCTAWAHSGGTGAAARAHHCTWQHQLPAAPQEIAMCLSPGGRSVRRAQQARGQAAACPWEQAAPPRLRPSRGAGTRRGSRWKHHFIIILLLSSFYCKAKQAKAKQAKKEQLILYA